MAATAAPYGLVPVNLIGGQAYAGSFRQIKMTNSYGTSVFFGDVLTMAATGTVEATQAATSSRPIGIFMGCEYTDPTLNYKVHSQMWTASTSATDIVAYVCDDPDAVFMGQSDASVAQTALGLNVEFATYAAGNTNIGKSIVALDGGSAATTNTFPLRIIDFVVGPDSAVGDSFTDLLVKWNFGIHSYELALGQ